MNTRLLFLATMLVADLSVAALPPETLPLAMQQQVAAQQGLSRQQSEANATLRKWYESALDAIRKDATGKGDLNSVLATDQERDRLDRDLTPEEKSKLSPPMRKVRDQYDQALVQTASQQKAKLAASLRAYITTLELLEKRFTQDSNIERALASRDERTKAEEELKALVPAAVPAGGAPAASTPLAANQPPVKGQGPRVPDLADGESPNESEDLIVWGTGFSMATLQENGVAFSNRGYVWQKVPASLRGKRYTKVNGGARLPIKVKAKRDTVVEVITDASEANVKMAGWDKTGIQFTFNNGKDAKVVVFKKKLAAGQQLEIPQESWTGGLVLLPAL